MLNTSNSSKEACPFQGSFFILLIFELILLI